MPSPHQRHLFHLIFSFKNVRRVLINKYSNWRSWEIGIDTYTLSILYIKYKTNENTLHSTEHSAECTAVTRMGRKSVREEYVYVYG